MHKVLAVGVAAIGLALLPIPEAQAGPSDEGAFWDQLCSNEAFAREHVRGEETHVGLKVQYKRCENTTHPRDWGSPGEPIDLP